MRTMSHIKSLLRRMLKSRDLPVFLIFLFLSLCFWFLNALRRDYLTTIDIPVVYSRFPDDVMSAPDVKRSVSVVVKAEGFQLLKYKGFNYFDPVDINVDHLLPYKRGKEFGVFFVPKHYVRLFQQQLVGGPEFQEILSDTVFIPFLPKLTRKLPVKPYLKLTFEKQYMMSGAPVIMPDSVVVSGYFETVDTMRWVSTRLLESRNVKDSLDFQLDVVIPRDVVCDVRNVKVVIPVEAFTEKSMQVQVHALHLPDNYQFKSFPSTVRVNFLVGMSRFNQIQPSDFSATVDCHESQGLSANKLKVRIEKMPQGIYNMSYSPIFVDYLIEKDRY